jgi:hypothetical protein
MERSAVLVLMRLKPEEKRTDKKCNPFVPKK